MAQGNYILISGNFTLTADALLDQLPTQEVRLIVDTSLVACNITLFASSAQGRFPQPKILVIDASGNAAANNITIIAGAGDTIDGVAATAINTNGGMCKVEMFEIGAWGTLFATPSGSGLLPFLTNFIYVDATNGNDVSGLPYRIDKCFATITAAEAVAGAGDVIYIFPGAYTDVGLGKNFVFYYYCAGATLTSAGNCYNDAGAGAGITMGVFGYGVFQSTTIAFQFANPSTVTINGVGIRFTSGGIDVTAAATTVNVNLLGDITSTGAVVGDGIIVRGAGSRVTAKFRDVIVGASALVVVAPDDPTCILEVNCNNIESVGAGVSSFAVNHLGGTMIINCNKAIKDDPTAAATVNIDSSAGISGRLTFNGDIVCPETGVNVNLESGLAEIHGNINGGDNSVGGGVVTMSNGLMHKIYGNIITASLAAAVQVLGPGGQLYHQGRCVNTRLVGAGAGGYLTALSNALILGAGNAIITSAAGSTSVDDGGAGLNVKLYGEVVANLAAAGTVVFTISTVGLTVDVAVQ